MQKRVATRSSTRVYSATTDTTTTDDQNNNDALVDEPVDTVYHELPPYWLTPAPQPNVKEWWSGSPEPTRIL